MSALMIRQAVRAGDCDPAMGLELARELERQALGSASLQTTSREGRALNERLAGFFAQVLAVRGPDVHDYLSRAMSYESERLTSGLHVCGKRLFLLTLVPKVWSGGARYLWVCERCGKVCDGASLDDYAALRADADRVETKVPVHLVGRVAWLSAAVQPIGGQPEVPIGPKQVELGPIEHVPLPRQLGDTGLRRFAVAIVVDGDYVISQLSYGAGD